VFVAVLVAVTLIAGFLRIWLAFHSALDADEAIVGLLAQGIRHGHFSAFYWGQHYGGVEPYSVAAMFGVFGQAPAVLVLTASVLALVTSLVVWRIGLRLFSPGAAMTAAVLAWIWPEVALWNSTREYGFHQIGVLLGMVVFLGALRIVDDPPPRPGGPRDWVLCGVAAGLGWWATPEVLYMALPAAYLLVAGLRGREAAGVRLEGAGVEADDVVAKHTRTLLEGAEQSPGYPPAPVFGPDIHPLDLPEAGAEAAHPAASDRLVVHPAHQVHAVGPPEIGRVKVGPVEAVGPAVQGAHLFGHGRQELTGRWLPGVGRHKHRGHGVHQTKIRCRALERHDDPSRPI
jgi:hypothetical protein